MLEAAEIELDRRLIAREELVEALAVSAAGTTAVTEAEKEGAPSFAPVPGSTVSPWRDGLPVTVLAPDYQRILGVLEQQRSAGHGPLRAEEISVELGLGTTPAKTRQDTEALREEVVQVLAPVGLRLSPAKTQVVHLTEGFDFLGFHIQWRRKRGTDK
ncbi:hypothetical protein ACWGJX_41415, partial [Streptomyces sp. NPDC054775]